MPNLRHERVRELLKREIGEAIRREFNVDDVGLITINDMDVGGDLKSAVVFISVLGNAGQQKRALQVLEENRIRIQGLVAKSVVLKYTPTLKFAWTIPLCAATGFCRSLKNWKRNLPANRKKCGKGSDRSGKK